MDTSLQNQAELNVFRPKDPDKYEAESEAWKKLSQELLGEESGSEDGSEQEEGTRFGRADWLVLDSDDSEDSEEGRMALAAQNKEAAHEAITDYTAEELVELRKKVYLAIMSSANFEECVHKVILRIRFRHIFRSKKWTSGKAPKSKFAECL